jgi:hypothetical protein
VRARARVRPRTLPHQEKILLHNKLEVLDAPALAQREQVGHQV